MLAQGHTETEIAQVLGVHVSTISRDVKVLKELSQRFVFDLAKGELTYYYKWTNKTGNDEVMFRASTDGGATFADKINLSNSTGAESQDVEIAADGDNVIVTWWERNQTANEPVLRISSDNRETFGPLLKLASNGTIGQEG